MKSRHILIIGNNEEMNLPVDTVDAVVTSPPYKADFLWYNIYAMADQLRDVLRGPLWLNFGDMATRMNRAPSVAQSFEERGFTWLQTIIWVKSIFGKGQFTPRPGIRGFNSTHEYIYLMLPTSFRRQWQGLDRLAIGEPYTDKSNITRFKRNHDLRCPGTVWFMPYETVQSKHQKLHSHRFPLELPTRCLQASFLRKNAWVLDPYAGSGTTGLAAKNLNCNSIMYERDEDMIPIVQERIPDVEVIY